jgi:FkbM family methyltransferase
MNAYTFRYKNFSFLATTFFLVYSFPFKSYYRDRILWEIRKKIIKEKQFYFPWAMHNGTRICISKNDILNQFGVGTNCFKNRAWECHVEEVVLKIVKPNSIVWDIGANIGYFTALFSKIVGRSGKVFAFEPVTESWLQLNKILHLCEHQNTQPFRLALGDVPGVATISYDPSISGNASIYQRSGNSADKQEEIQIQTIDALVGNELSPCDFIKIDTEGNELKALKGGQEFLRTHKPIVLYEFNRETAGLADYSFGEMAEFFFQTSNDYEIFIIMPGGFLIKITSPDWDVPFGCHIDLVAIPKSRNPIKC